MTAEVPPPVELEALARRVASAAGAHALERRRLGVSVSTKSTTTDMVTDADRATEVLIVDQLLDARPDDGIVGEEGGEREGASGVRWIIDPIDGTTNFVYDHAAWACSIGVSSGGEMVAGAVYVPPAGELFAAARGHGATLNGTPISPTAEGDLALALVGTGFTYHAAPRVDQAQVVAALIGEVRDIRRLGSAAVDLCMVACGRLDIYYERYLNSWDAAAGELIAREAGASTSDWSGAAPTPQRLLAAAPGIHAALLRLLEHAAPTPA